MSTFLVALSRSGPDGSLRARFRRAVHMACLLHDRPATAITENDRICVASFPRENGTGGVVQTDPATGSWLVATGSPLHREGLVGHQLLARALQVGARALAREVDGPCAIALWDETAGTLEVFTDLAGLRTAFMAEDDGKRTLFLSSSSSLLASITGSELDPVGFEEFLRTTMVFEGRTIFRRVRRLRPAAIHRFAAECPDQVSACWTVTEAKPDSLRGGEAAEALLASLRESVRRIEAESP